MDYRILLLIYFIPYIVLLVDLVGRGAGECIQSLKGRARRARARIGEGERATADARTAKNRDLEIVSDR